MTRSTVLAPLLLLAALPSLLQGQHVPPDPELAEIPPLAADLGGYEYPFQVERFEIQEQGQGLQMAYMDLTPTTEPNGCTVVLLHGKNFSGAYWQRTAEALAGRGFRVVMPDQIGFGRSSKPTDIQYSLHMMASHTRALLDHLGIQDAAVVGHSMGGMLAARFALMFPETTSRLALVNPIGLEDWKRKVPYQGIDAGTAAEMKKQPEDVKAYMRDVYFGGEWKDDYNSLLIIQAGWLKGPDKEKLARISAITTDMIMTQPVVHEFPDIEVPTLLVIGLEDKTALGKDRVPEEVAKTLGNYPELAKETAAAIPDAKLVTLPGVGHAPQVEAFDAYLEALLDFLEGGD